MAGTSKLQTQSPLGHWLPRDKNIIIQWLIDKVKEAQVQQDDLNPSLVHFKQVVEADPALLKLANDMFTEVPNKPPYNEDPTGANPVADFEGLLAVMNTIMQQGPQFYEKADPPSAMGLIGFPINAVLDWPMGTRSGYFFFVNPVVNQALAVVLKAWSDFLASPASQQCLSGWLSSDGQTLLAAKGNDGKTSYTFDQLYVCDSSEPFLGFPSWDAFFTRSFRDGIRPVEVSDNAPPNPRFPNPRLVITNACESAPLQTSPDGPARNVQWQDTFWLKGQPYSLGDMLNYNALANQFIGGTVYQAFLSALSYHCWHAPVSGKVGSVELVPGTYYSENMYEGFANDAPAGADPAAPNYSQPYISSIAARGIIYIQADDPAIGLIALVFIGMAEVSSCQFTVGPGQHVTKGDVIGKFHFGGSSHCMVFRPGVDVQFLPPTPWQMDTEMNLPVNSALAVVAGAQIVTP